MLRASLNCSRRLRANLTLQGGLQRSWDALRGITEASSNSTGQAASAAGVVGSGGGEAAALAAAAPAGGSSSSSGDASTPDRVAKVLAHAFHKAPKDTASALIREMTDLDRIQLVLALQRHTNQERIQKAEQAYVDDLLKQVLKSPNKQHAKLTRQQIHNAVVYQRMLRKFANVGEEPPSLRQLAAVAFASGLPFVAFGILLVAGEQIDHLFGARLGLTVLASAGLGNMVADVVGVSVTTTIQDNIKRVRFAQPPRLSLLQQQLVPVKVAQLLGAALGVAVGCLIGMTPLLVMEPGFFVHAADAASSAAAALGAAGSGGSGGAEQVAEQAAAAAATAAAIAQAAEAVADAPAEAVVGHAAAPPR